MKFWIFTHSDQPLEHWLEGYQQRFDAWEEGGVEGIIVGRMQFKQDDGSIIPSYPANPKLYAEHGVELPEETPRDLEKEKKLQAMMDDAAARGWQIMTFGMGRGGVVGLEDLITFYPQVHGVIIDGPGENHYELAFHHGGELLELRPGEDQQFAAMGADVGRMQRGVDHLRQALCRLTPQRVRYLAQGGLFSVLNLIDLDEDGLYWLRMRQEKSRRSWADARTIVDQALAQDRAGWDSAHGRRLWFDWAGLRADGRILRLYTAQALLLASRI